jgi:hypothetical protein
MIALKALRNRSATVSSITNYPANSLLFRRSLRVRET